MLDVDAEPGLLEPGYAEPGEIPLPAVRVGTLTLRAVLNPLTDPTDFDRVTSARVETGWDRPYATATVTLATIPTVPDGEDTGYLHNKPISVILGRGTNDVERFKGRIRDLRPGYAPSSYVLDCAGWLSLLDEYTQKDVTVNANSLTDTKGPTGKTLLALTGSSTATLRQIVAAVLDEVSAAFDGLLTYDLANLANPAHVYGTVAPEKCIWATGQSAREFLDPFFKASEGYRLFESGDGVIYLAQIYGRPSNDPDFTLTQGDNLLDLSGGKLASETRNSVVVTGYDPAGTAGPVRVILNSSNALQPVAGSHPFAYSAELIETAAWGTVMAYYALGEVNRVPTRFTAKTPEDFIGGPAQTHLVDAVRGDLTDAQWVKSATFEAPPFTATYEYVGGGLAPETAAKVPV